MVDLISELPILVMTPDYERVDWLNNVIQDAWPYFDKEACGIIKSSAEATFAEYIGKFKINSIYFERLTLGNLPLKIQGSIQMVDIQISAATRAVLRPFVPSFPCFSSISVSLMEKPKIDFGLKILGGDIMSIPGLYQFVQEIVERQVAKMYLWPQTYGIDILDSSLGATKKPVGILHVNIVRARQLLNKDFLSTSDPYVKLSLTGERLSAKKTTVKMNNLNPEWNECKL